MIIYGKQTCFYVLQKHSNIIEEIYFEKEIPKDIFRQFLALNKPTIRLDSKKAQALAKGGNHQGYLLKINFKAESSFKILKDSSKIIVIVGISDIGNIGSIFRTAYAFGIDGIISTSKFNENGVARVSSGAFFDMPYVVYKDYLSLANELKMSGFKLIGSSANEVDSNNNICFNKWALFLGSEGDGLPNRLLKRMDSILSIKMQNFDSLNVSVAAGILTYRMVTNGMY